MWMATYTHIAYAKHKGKGSHLYPGSPLKASTEPLHRMVSPEERSFARAHSAILKKPALRASSDGPCPISPYRHVYIQNKDIGSNPISSQQS